MENRCTSFDSGRSLSKWSAGSRLPEKSMDKEGAGYAINSRRRLNNPIYSRFGGEDEETSLHSYESVNRLIVSRGFRETSPQLKDLDGLLYARSSRAGNDQGEERGERFQAFSRNPPKPQYQAAPFYGHGNPTKSHHSVYEPNSLENLERDREELTWKLEQLNYQIGRSKEAEQRFPGNKIMVPGDHFNARFEHYDGPASSNGPYEMEVPSVQLLPSDLHNPFGPRVVGTTSNYTHFSSNGAFVKERMKYVNPEPFESYPRDAFPPHPPFSRKILEDSFDPEFQHHVGPVWVRQVDPEPIVSGSRDQLQSQEMGLVIKERMKYVNPEPFESYPRDPFPPHPPFSRKILEDSFDPQFQHHVGPVWSRQVDPDPVVSGSRDQLQSHERQSTSGSSNPASLGHTHTKIVPASNKSRKHHVAVAGGAPFIICSNCFSLLILPRRLRIKESNRDKARCGSCSAVINVQLKEKRLMTCTIIEDSKEEANNRDMYAVLKSEDDAQGSSLVLSDCGRLKSYDDAEEDFSWTKSEENAFSREEGVVVSRDEEMAGFDSVISLSEKDKEAEEEGKGSPKDMIVERDDHTCQALPGSPLGKNPQNSGLMIDYESQWMKGKSSDNTNHEKALLQKSDSPHASFKDDPEITEVEISASEYPITSLSQDSTDTSKEQDQAKNKKGGRRSFFKGLMKRSVREQPVPEPIMENERAEVTVNGHPIPEDVVKQAEVHAGPILPGDYWYDYHSGFWGVMKHPCLGIIPPSIEEFNYPLPTNCSRGNTGIFVNGRQLHQHDLKLLASRGLPTTRNQFYKIDIYGKVIDEDTGEHLHDLGKLAPTILKAGHGFGMRVPRGMV